MLTQEQKEEFLNKLKELSDDNEGIEINHINADIVLCNILKLLGYNDIVEQYDKVRKWYA